MIDDFKSTALSLFYRAKRRMSQSLTHSVSVTDDTEKSSADVNPATNANNGGNLTVPGNGNGGRIWYIILNY